MIDEVCVQLMRAHDDAYAEMKRYYNDITRANLDLISQLKAQIAEASSKQVANQKLMLEIATENQRLSDPLQVRMVSSVVWSALSVV
jgi:mRNA-degrading endonuclease HigB of HigAB toxin-antitoxin module